MALIKTLSGNINLRDQSGQVRIFHCPRAGGLGNKEVFLDKAAKEGPTIEVVRKVGMPTLSASIPGKKGEIVGRYAEQTFDIEDGEVLKVFVDTRSSYGSRPKRACVYLRIRSSAAHRIVEFDITNHASAAFTKGYVEGTFDIITLGEVDALGVSVLRHYRAFAHPGAVQRVISRETILRPETESAVRTKKVVSVIEGEKKEVFVVARPRRRIG